MSTTAATQHEITPTTDIPLSSLFESRIPLTGADWVCLLLMEIVNAAVFLWRDMSIPYNQLVLHWMSWMVLTDCAVLGVPPHRRHWYNGFRCTESLVLIYTTIYLAFHGLDGNHSAWRLGIASLRLVHAVFLLVKYETNLQQVWNLPTCLNTIWDSRTMYKTSKVFIYIGLILALSAILVPHFLYLFHFNFGEPKFDAIFTSLQASFGIHVNIKKLVLCCLTESRRWQAVVAWWIFMGFAMQWIPMWDMFAKAPFPYMHAVAELMFLVDAVVLTNECLAAPRKMKDSNHGYDTVAQT